MTVSTRARSCGPACTRRPASSTSCASTAPGPRTARRSRIPTSSTTRRPTCTRARARRRSQRVRVRHPLVDCRPGPARLAPRRSSRTSRIDHADGTREVITTDATRGARTRDRGFPARPATTRATSSSTSTSDSSPIGLGPARLRRPRLAPPRSCSVAHPVVAVPASRRGAHPHRRTSRCEPVTLHRLARRHATSPTSAPSSPATPVVDFHAGVVGPGGEARRAATCSTRTVTSRRRAASGNRHALGLTTSAPARSSSGRSAISASATSRSTARPRPLDRGRRHVAARHADLPDEHAASFHTSNPAHRRGLEPRPPLRACTTRRNSSSTRRRARRARSSATRYDVSQAAMAAFGERAMTSQALRDFARSQTRYWPDGRVNAVYPNGDGKRDIPDSTEDYVEWVWQYWMTTGDRDQLAALYPVVRNITDYLATRDRPEDRPRHEPARRRRRLPRRHRRLAAADALRLRHEHDRAHRRSTCSRSTSSGASPRSPQTLGRPPSESDRADRARRSR